jgi:hypothetical protein
MAGEEALKFIQVDDGRNDCLVAEFPASVWLVRYGRARVVLNLVHLE